MTEERTQNKCAGGAYTLALASVALNLFLVGVIVSPMLGGRGPMPPLMPPEMQADMRGGMQGPQGPRGGAGFIMDRLGKDLSQEEAAKLRTILDEEHKVAQGGPHGLREAMGKLADILKQDKPDTDAMRKVFAEIEESGKGLHKGMERAFERMASELSPDSRRKIAEAMASGPGRMMPPPPPPSMPEDRRGGPGPMDNDRILPPNADAGQK